MRELWVLVVDHGLLLFLNMRVEGHEPFLVLLYIFIWTFYQIQSLKYRQYRYLKICMGSNPKQCIQVLVKGSISSNPTINYFKIILTE